MLDLHPVILYPLGLHRFECTPADKQRYRNDFHVPLLEQSQQVRCEMKAGRGRGYCS